jgi:hypothetical protein
VVMESGGGVRAILIARMFRPFRQAFCRIVATPVLERFLQRDGTLRQRRGTPLPDPVPICQ